MPVLNGGTGVTTATGSGSVVLNANATLITPTLAGATLSNNIAGGGNQINNVVIGASTPLGASFTVASTYGGVVLHTTSSNPNPNTGAQTDFVGSKVDWLTSNNTNGWEARIVQPTGYFVDNADLVFSEGTANTEVARLVAPIAAGGAKLVVTGAISATGVVSSTGGYLAVAGNSSADSRFTFDVVAVAGGAVGINNSGITNVYGVPTGTAYLGVAQSIPLVFTNAATEKMRLDASGNLGLGVTPSAWGGSFKSFDVSQTSISGTAGGALVQSGNAYFDGASWRYKVTNAATRVELNASTSGVAWFTAPSGTAGNPITFTQAMTLNASGNLSVVGSATAASFSGAGTGLTGTAASFTAGNVTTNANLTGAVTSSGNATSLGSFTSAQLATALTDETGSGANVFATNPSLTNPTLTAFTETVFTITDGASVDINPANGTIQLWTLGANRTPTATSFAAGQSITLMIADGTAYAVTWTTIGVTWVGGTAPTLPTTGYGVIVLWKVASTVYGTYTGAVA